MPGPVRLVGCVNQRLGSGQGFSVGSGSLDSVLVELERFLGLQHDPKS